MTYRYVSLLDFVDKRGRKVKESASEDLSKFYELCDEDGMCTVAIPGIWLKGFVLTTVILLMLKI